MSWVSTEMYNERVEEIKQLHLEREALRDRIKDLEHQLAESEEKVEDLQSSIQEIFEKE